MSIHDAQKTMARIFNAEAARIDGIVRHWQEVLDARKAAGATRRQCGALLGTIHKHRNRARAIREHAEVLHRACDAYAASLLRAPAGAQKGRAR